MPLAPVDESVMIKDLVLDPYPIYRRMRAETPVVRVPSVNRTLLTKAEFTKMVKDDAELFSSNDPESPMHPAFRAHTLMRKDGDEHRRERMAMQKAFTPKIIKTNWAQVYRDITAEYLDRLPRGETVDLYQEICGPVSARILIHILGLHGASDEDMMRWSQQLIDGAGNFGWDPDLFAITDRANQEMNVLIADCAERLRAEPDDSALSLMVNAADPIPWSQVEANIKIAIGGGINEPRDAMATIIYGLLTNPEQLEEVRRQEAWGAAFEEGVRWVAPIQCSSRVAMDDIQIGGCDIAKGDILMTVQASANRDEDLYEDSENFHVFRDKNVHQAFGSGPHHCAGAHIARRTVGEIMMPALFERFPNMTLPDPEAVKWRGFGFRGPINMPVTLN
ncbi:cytochrome P450 [Pseudooceanicola sp. HF7]|uniref:cytochrome P450 n=1 Tax=Pseudooceanicola sp. HF7 TaxID=2721560 RepID=UPI001431F73B|nr:cytochrome P450 [Pseudooceanicola sp. HF7]NIZ11375.1 cytochrome P450 [Pseudooceanicola sp. HF7]